MSCKSCHMGPRRPRCLLLHEANLVGAEQGDDEQHEHAKHVSALHLSAQQSPPLGRVLPTLPSVKWRSAACESFGKANSDGLLAGRLQALIDHASAHESTLAAVPFLSCFWPAFTQHTESWSASARIQRTGA